MVNIDEFIKRLETILDYYNINASSFADKIGVQRSSLSHLLSGRNKPSLDFILKITEEFPEVDLYWLINGIGRFPNEKGKENTTINTPKESEKPKMLHDSALLENMVSKNLFTAIEPINNEPIETKKQVVINEIGEINNGEVEKIVFFYKNGTFKIFNSL